MPTKIANPAYPFPFILLALRLPYLRINKYVFLIMRGVYFDLNKASSKSSILNAMKGIAKLAARPANSPKINVRELLDAANTYIALPLISLIGSKPSIVAINIMVLVFNTSPSVHFS
jgi:hypothetical protein